MKNNILLKISGGIMILIGFVNILKGFKILSEIDTLVLSPISASSSTITLVGISTIIVSVLLIATGILLFMGKSVWWLSLISITIFIAVSFMNYSVIEGETLALGSMIDVSFGFILIILIYLGKKKDPLVTEDKIQK